MFGLNKSQLKNGLILALIIFLVSQVFKEYNSALIDGEEDYLDDLNDTPVMPVQPKSRGKVKRSPKKQAAVNPDESEVRFTWYKSCMKTTE